MAQAVAGAIQSGENLVVEAGTGTGKTLAYLVPALLAERQIIISTGTRTLQDQLFHRDLPTIGKALGRPAEVRLLKGRANYLCRHRLETLRDGADESTPAESLGALPTLQAWAARTRTGDIAEVVELPEDSSVWPRVTSTVDNCLGAQCAWFDDCHVFAARQAARVADVVVVNHHLLMADLTMKEEGFGELLPVADAVIVDEAHHFPKVAQSFFNVSLSSGQVYDLVSDIRGESVNAGLFGQNLARALESLRRGVDDARLALPSGEGNLAWAEIVKDFPDAMGALVEALVEVQVQLDSLGHEHAGLARCTERTGALITSVGEILDADEDVGLRWVRRTRRSFTANVTPLDAAQEIRALLAGRACTWVFTSATLAVRDDFGHFTQRLGLDQIATRQIASPFAYSDIARLYLPTGLPEPSAPDYTDAAVGAMRDAVKVSDGRAFLLFTSHRALRRAAEILADDPSFDYPLLVQGQLPRTQLLAQFSRQDHSVLLGTATFWEGVDIRGHDLVLVAIDRLPFASPGDPMLAARLSLKQGVGRLIRDYDDYGVIMICDPRVLGKSYGRDFLASLPSMPSTRDLEDVKSFFQERNARAKP